MEKILINQLSICTFLFIVTLLNGSFTACIDFRDLMNRTNVLNHLKKTYI